MSDTTGAAFSPSFSVHSMDDIKELEKTPLEKSVTTKSTYELFVNSAKNFGEQTALRFLKTAEPGGDTIAWTYNELLEKIHQTANMLNTLGVGPEDAVSVLLPGCLEYHLALWGGEAAGIVNPLNPLQSEDNLIELMRASKTKVLISYGEEAEASYWTKTLNVMHKVPTLQCVLRVSAVDGTSTGSDALPDGVHDFHTQLQQQPNDRLVSGRIIAPDDVAAYFHTGGTTGAPKLAKHLHRNQVFTAWASVQLQNIKNTDATINGYPLFHVAGVLPGALAALSAGVEVIIPTTRLMRNPEVIKNYWKLVDFHNTTVLSAVPTSLATIATVPLDGADISSIKMCRTGAAPLPPELGERFKAQFDISIHESWGMTEMAGISSISPPSVDSPIGCVGFPIPYSRYKVVGFDGNGNLLDSELPQGETGMLLAKSPNVFPGYVNEAATKKAFTAEGWLITGDLGFVDKEGRIHLNGRAKDLIIRSAHNIDPRMIEDALDAHPAVGLCAAVGAPDVYAGELPVAYVTLKPGAEVSEDELMAFSKGRIEDALANPKRITVLETMPTTNVGKIFKPELRRIASGEAIDAKAQSWLQDKSLTVEAETNAVMDALGKIQVTVQVRAEDSVVKELTTELNQFPIPVTVKG